jgi:hypothetical protein
MNHHSHFCAAALTVALIASLASSACTTTTMVPAPTTSPDATEADDAGTAETDGAIVDAAKAPPDSGSGKIGTLDDKGVKTVDVDFSDKTSYTCDGVCNKAGGFCEEGGGNGVGQVSRRYNDGSGTLSNRISGCDFTQSYFSGNTTMTSMVCYCDGLMVPPTVRVRKTEGFFACSKVCSSWSLTCSTTRKHYTFIDELESASTQIDCNKVPEAGTTHHYTCACDR